MAEVAAGWASGVGFWLDFSRANYPPLSTWYHLKVNYN